MVVVVSTIFFGIFMPQNWGRCSPILTDAHIFQMGGSTSKQKNPFQNQPNRIHQE